ncbi:AI-2E family transporter [Thalassotalea sp. LPB0316]|uniref:AI-2E family transporter n=1 Tax=Thalassotalea sp. LPB0316 TaxID=2769490 RepID=UPI0018666D86|nr:AI-2E family transporter [Thalassotalea sp. LPB0316]QOL26361.1 AI-2E family transporter [Thalassotalea sp. LPB0316]
MSELDAKVTRLTIDIVLKLAVIIALLAWSFSIVSPFILLLVWAGILAVALYPLQQKLTSKLSKQGLSSSIVVLVLISILVVPLILFGNSTFDSVHEVYQKANSGQLTIPSANENVKSWPLIGEKIYQLWRDAEQHTQVFIQEYKPEISEGLKRIVGAAAGTLGTMLMLIVSLIIAAVFMTNSQSISNASSKFLNRMMSDNSGSSASKGERTKQTIVATVRSVATGVLGIALIQAILLGLGMVVAGIPAAGILALVVLIFAIAQLPVLIIMLPLAGYYFSVADTTPAVLFLIYSVVISISDAFLKPMFLGRGMDIPMPVILLGAIGGMLLHGIIGLFVGAVILALSYELMIDWLNIDQEKDA